MKNLWLLSLALLCGFSLNAVTVAQTAQPQNPSLANAGKKMSWPALSQKMLLDKSDKLDKKAVTLTLQLDNLRDDDVVNIGLNSSSNSNNKDHKQLDNATVGAANPETNIVEFSAATYFITGDPEKKSFSDLVSFGALPAETALTMGSNTINFVRAENLMGKLIVNVQVPPQTIVKMVINNKTIINSPVSQPLAWRNGAIGKGEINRLVALLKTVKPNIRELPPGTVNVKFDQLKIRKQSELPLKEGVLILARLSINPGGRVTDAKILYGEAPEELQNSFYNWEFEPHIVDGKPVPVETLVPVRY
jgi:hypothetical protein